MRPCATISWILRSRYLGLTVAFAGHHRIASQNARICSRLISATGRSPTTPSRMRRLWAAAINRHGGEARVVHLPEIGIYGNTHFPFSDLNNVQIADLMSKFLAEKQLD